MSAVCQRCKRDMMGVDSCTGYTLNIEGTEYFRVKFGSEKGLFSPQITGCLRKCALS